MANEIGIELPSGHAAEGGNLFVSGSMQLRDVLKVIVPNGLTFGVVTFTQLEQVLKVGLLVLSIVYTVLHIALLWRKLKRKTIQDQPDI